MASQLQKLLSIYTSSSSSLYFVYIYCVCMSAHIPAAAAAAWWLHVQGRQRQLIKSELQEGKELFCYSCSFPKDPKKLCLNAAGKDMFTYFLGCFNGADNACNILVFKSNLFIPLQNLVLLHLTPDQTGQASQQASCPPIFVVYPNVCMQREKVFLLLSLMHKHTNKLALPHRSERDLQRCARMYVRTYVCVCPCMYAPGRGSFIQHGFEKRTPLLVVLVYTVCSLGKSYSLFDLAIS